MPTLRPKKRKYLAVEDEEKEEQQPQLVQQPLRKRTAIIKGQKMEYYYVKTVKSLPELNKYRFKENCNVASKMLNSFRKSVRMVCTRKRTKKGCDFELMAVRPELKSSTIHVYAHSKHNHPILSEERRSLIKTIDLMPDANPPTIFHTQDSIEWQYLQTFSNYDKMQTFRSQNKCRSRIYSETWGRIRLFCNRKSTHNCPFMLLALKTTKTRYHVYKHGEHTNHLDTDLRKGQRKNVNKHAMEDEDEEDEDSEEDEEDEENSEEEEHEQESDDVSEDDNENEEEEDEPPRNIVKNIMGQKREYHLLQTVKTPEEVDNIRFENYCVYYDAKPRNILKSLIMPCSRKRHGKRCDFELRAERPSLESRNIHVYAYSKHNHPIIPRSLRIENANTLMPHKNPPKIFCTPDNIEYTFLQRFPTFDKMEKFRQKNQCKATQANKNGLRIRYFCNFRYFTTQNCQFTLLAVKTTKHGYHVYQHGQHKHNNNHPDLIKKQQFNHLKNLYLDEQEQMEDDEEETEDEDSENSEDDDHEEEEDSEEEEEDEDEKDKDEEGDEDEDEDGDEGEEDGEEEESGEEEGEEDEEGEEEGSMEIGNIPVENPREETSNEKLQEANRKVYEWMAGIEPNEIEGTIGEWDKLSLLKMVEMADQEIREHPQKLNLWLPWLKCAIPKCLPQIDGFNMRFKDLIKLTSD